MTGSELRAESKSARGLLTIVFDGFENLLAFVAGIMIVFAMTIVTLDVIMRMFQASLWWSFEVTEFILVYIPLLTLPWLARRRAHITIDIVASRLAPATARRLSVLISLIAALICAFVAYWGFIATMTAYTRGIVNSGMVAYPRWALLFVIPLGFGLGAVEFVRVAWQNVRQEP